MSDNAEEGIARAQNAAARQQGGGGASISDQQQRGSRYINDRIVTFVFAIAGMLLIGVWATAKSPLVLYGSLGLVICLAVLWGVLRIRKINRIRQDRRNQAAAWNRNEG